MNKLGQVKTGTFRMKCAQNNTKNTDIEALKLPTVPPPHFIFF